MNSWASAVVGFGGLTAPQQLVDPMPLGQVFTRQERLRSGAGRTLEHWAGRLAAKYAVLRLLGVPVAAERLGAVEVLPRPSAMCAKTSACLHGHPPGVRLLATLGEHGDSDTQIRVSVSHTAGVAVAVALASGRLSEDHDWEAVSGWT